MTYALWDSQSGNIIGTSDTKEEALSIVRQALAKHGAAYVETLLFLVSRITAARPRRIARGKKLVQIALAEAPARSA